MKNAPSPTRPPTLRLALLALLAAPGWLVAQGGMPVGPEFQINTYTTISQSRPSVAADSAGNFVVVWQSYQDGSFFGVFGQRYASAGAPLGGEFRVNTYTTLMQAYPSVASASAGNFVVVWESLGQLNAYQVFGQRYSSAGAPLGGEFRVNTYITANKKYPAVASDPAGNFVVVWTSYYQEGLNWGIYAQRFDSSGAPLGGEFRVNTFTPTHQVRPAVASDSAGNFVVVWQSNAQDGSLYGVFAQRYASTGAPLGGEFRVNTYITGQQWWPRVASDSAGNFVVAWHDDGASRMSAQRYASTGAPLGGEFRVNTGTVFLVGFPSVTSDSAGNFVVVWQSYQDPGGAYGVYGQRYASNGAPLGGEFRVNSYTFHHQRYPAVSANAAGAFVVAWDSYSQDGHGGGIFGQRYNLIVPVELQDFSIE